jgi:hypothetical protein
MPLVSIMCNAGIRRGCDRRGMRSVAGAVHLAGVQRRWLGDEQRQPDSLQKREDPTHTKET